MSGLAYAHAVGRIKVKETKLLDENIINRLIDEPQLESVYRILEETDYGQYIGEIRKGNISSRANLAYKELKDFLLEIAPNPDKIKLFYFKYDFHNMKLLFKSHYLEKDASSYLMPLGNIDPEILIKHFSGEEEVELDNEVKDIISELLEKPKDSFDSFILDVTLDKHYFEFLTRKSRKYKEKFINEWLKTEIDLANIKTYIRIENLHIKEELQHLSEYLIPGGSIPHDTFLNNIDDYPAFINKLSVSCYAKIVGEGIAYYQQHKTFSLLEKLMDNFIIELAKKSRFVLFGIEPLIGYLLAREKEMKILRIILTCKISGLPIETIKERVGEVYV